MSTSNQLHSNLSDVPPGLRLEPNTVCFASDGGIAPWLPFDKKKNYTNAFIIHDGKVLLGYKKRGFGKGKFNGFGGKLEPGETPLQAAKRELEEEACIQAPLEHAGELLFVIEGDQTAFHIDIFRADEYAGIVTEYDDGLTLRSDMARTYRTDEMRPQWFRTDDTTPHKAGSSEDKNTYLPIPFDQMWDDDVHWFPLLLKKQFFVGRSDFLRDGDNFVPCRWWFGTDCIQVVKVVAI